MPLPKAAEDDPAAGIERNSFGHWFLGILFRGQAVIQSALGGVILGPRFRKRFRRSPSIVLGSLLNWTIALINL